MARKPRTKSSSGIYHIILRGINRQNIFEDDEDRMKLLETLAKYKAISQCRIFGYCLMDNHFHILLQEIQEPIGMMIQRISSSYVLWYNAKHERCGHLFQERFRSEPVGTDAYFLTVLRYIHQNPVKAKLVKDVAEYKWSSYNEYTLERQIVDTEYTLPMFADKPDNAVECFEQFSREANVDTCLEIPAIKVTVSDDDLRKKVRHQFGMEVIKVCHETREKQDDIVRAMKAVDGANIRQIARITGLSSTRVWKA